MTTPRQQAPRPAEGLLEQIAEQALDDDYYMVRAEEPRWTDRLMTGLAVGAFALMVTVAAVQTQLDRPATERQQETLADNVASQRAIQENRLSRVQELKADVASLASAADRNDPDTQALLIGTAGSDVRGDGVVVTVVPAASDGGKGDVRDFDLQQLVNGLWALGAEAVSVNNNRVGTLTSIRLAGQSITVNYESTNPPYVLRAIGDPDQLRERLETSNLGQDWQKRAADTGLEFEIDTANDLRLSAIDDAQMSLDHAEAVKE